MPPGSKKSSASSNSTGTLRNTAAVQVETAARTPALENLTSTPLIVASPSTRASASGAPSAKRRRVRGPTRGKRIRRILAENKGERISAYGFYSSWQNVNKDLQLVILQAVRDKFKVTENGVEDTELVDQVFQEKANQLYKDWKWRMNNFYTKTLDAGLDAYQHPFQEMPIDDWKYMIDHVFKDPNREARKKAGKLNREAVPYGHTTGSRSFAAVMTIAADQEKQRIANEGNDDAGNDHEPNSNEGNEGRKKLDLCDLFEASHRLRDTNEWINSTCKDKHETMVAIRDEAALSGTPLSAEELSIKCLGGSKTKNYIRGLGNGPKPSTYLSKSNSQSASQDQLQKLQRELDLIREEQIREREEEKMRREEEKRLHEEEKRQWEETQRLQAEERSMLLKEMEVFKSFMSQMQNGGRGNMGAG
ncbi:hypothetical protein RHSIM_RhsimUnG0101600 [Rhododendron simsii]|uniref:Uncharacterized protein n=1 Tax=Rhododendron simsii TaxID=118357 RepID=A0A834FWG7_RHOSS|nr:hypothetical protein RHSIM_RhsimUnG0101600 [Rhododendron simsii]